MAVNVKKGNSKQKTIINQLVIKAPNRQASDVGKWRTALKSADTGRVKALYDLFDDLYLDGVLFDAVDKRTGAVLNSELTFQDENGESVEEIKNLMDTPAWEDMLTIICKKITQGRSGLEFDFTDGFSVHEIPAKHIDLTNKIILINDSDSTGISYEDDDHLLILGKKQDFGLFIRTAPFVIWKRGGFGDYAQWLEIFGMPQRVGKYSSYDPESRRLLEEALDKAGSAPWCVVPKESEIETVQNTGNGSSGASYNDFRKACNEELLITVLGQTLTTIQGEKGARSLGEVHKEVEEGKNKSDMRFVQRVLNYFVKPILEKRGYPVVGGRFIFPEAAEQLSVSDIVQLSDIMDIPTSYLHDKYSIPVPKDGEPVAGKSQTILEPDDPEEIKNSDRNFFIRLWDFFASAPAATTGAMTGNRLTLSDSDLNNRVIDRVIDMQPAFDPELFSYFSRDFIRALEAHPAQLADLSYIYDYQNDAYRTAQELNIFHFSAAKTLAELTELNRIFRDSKSFSEFYQKAQQIADTFNKVWQKTEWETAVLISESHQNYHRLIQKVKLFPYWEYKTIGDDKVRLEHVLLDGIILPASDPRWKKIWPPNGWKCRCYIVPRMAHEVKDINFDEMRRRVDDYLSSGEWKISEAQGFGINRALLPELFTENQMYIKKFPRMASKLLKDINYQTYKLGSYEQCRAKATEEFRPYTGSAADFFKTLKSEDGKIFFTDYNGRSVLFNEEKYLKGHSPEKYKVRTAYLQAASEALRNPDEVWINSTNSNELNHYVFIKYYKNETVAVVASVENGQVYKINTWFPIHEVSKSKVQKFMYRWGLLIKQNPA